MIPKGSTEAFLRSRINYTGRGCLIWPYARWANGRGVATVGGKQGLAHRFMCIMVHGKPPTKRHHAAHTCGNGHLGCIHPRHLKWKTPKQNTADTIVHGTHNRGPRSGRTGLTIEDVRAIRSAPPNLIELMRKYGISKGCVSKIRSGARWAHYQ